MDQGGWSGTYAFALGASHKRSLLVNLSSFPLVLNVELSASMHTITLPHQGTLVFSHKCKLTMEANEDITDSPVLAWFTYGQVMEADPPKTAPKPKVVVVSPESRADSKAEGKMDNKEEGLPDNLQKTLLCIDDKLERIEQWKNDTVQITQTTLQRLMEEMTQHQSQLEADIQARREERSAMGLVLEEMMQQVEEMKRLRTSMAESMIKEVAAPLALLADNSETPSGKQTTEGLRIME
jgi:hypothetical protein